MEIKMEDFEKKLVEQKEKIQTTLQKHADNTKDQTDEVKIEVGNLTKKLDELSDNLRIVQENIKLANQLAIPGLKEEQKKKKFSFGAFSIAALASSRGVPEDKAWKSAGLEKEILDNYAKIAGPILGRKDMIAGDGTQGGYLIPEEVTSELIDMVIAEMVVLDMGPTVFRDLHGDLPIPRQTERPTGYWLGETEPPTESQAAFNEITLRPKKGGAFSKYSKRLSCQSRGTADQIIKNGIVESLNLLFDLGYLSGTGSDSQPKGILQQTGYTVTPNPATNGARFRIDKAASMKQAIDVANELKKNGNFGYIMRPEVLGGMMRERVPQFTGQPIGQGQPIAMTDILMSQEMLEQRIGYKIRTTTQLSGALAKGTSNTCSKVIFGNFKQLFIGFWRGMEIKVSDQASDASGNSAFLKDQFYIVAFQETDSNVGRVPAFTVVDDAETNEALWTNG